jgi:hypothetical protein
VRRWRAEPGGRQSDPSAPARVSPHLRATYELGVGDERFAVEVDRGTIAISRASPRRADATIATDPATLRAVVFGDRPLADAPVELAGDKRAAKTFFRLFARP